MLSVESSKTAYACRYKQLHFKHQSKAFICCTEGILCKSINRVHQPCLSVKINTWQRQWSTGMSKLGDFWILMWSQSWLCTWFGTHLSWSNLIDSFISPSNVRASQCARCHKAYSSLLSALASRLACLLNQECLWGKASRRATSLLRNQLSFRGYSAARSVGLETDSAQQ